MSRFSTSHRGLKPRAVGPGLVALMLLSTLSAVPSWAQSKPDVAAEKPQRAASHSSAKTLADLPPAALPAISSALGHDDARYGVRKTADGYSAQNAANHLDAHYAAEGVEVRSQNADLGFEFQGWGYGERPANKDKAAVAPRVNANRVEYRRGALTEWYVNGPLGIEQGFTISQPPVALQDSHHDALDIALRLRGNLSASIESGRHALTLRDQKGVEILRYGPLQVYDASGRELESWMEMQDGTLRLRVNTAGARYPILVDPWVQAVPLTVSSTLSAGIAGAVAVSGDTIVVGGTDSTNNATVDLGEVFVFVEPPTGGWAAVTTYTAELTALNRAAGDDFGSSVSIDAAADTIVVGAPYAPGGVGAGAAYVFVKPAGGWATTSAYDAELVADDVSPYGGFGWSVGIDASGDTVVVGAPFNPFGFQLKINELGEAYVFAEPLGGWAGTFLTETAKFIASDGSSGDSLGLSVGINESGDTVVAGAIDATNGPNGPVQYQGAVYVFVKPTVGGWVTPPATDPNYAARLTASDSTGHSYLGWSVGISGNTVVAGAYQAAAGQGAAYVFVAPNPNDYTSWVTPTTTPTFNAKLTASDGAALDEFGTSVAISGSTIVVGAASDIGGTGTGAAAAYVFAEPTPGGWTNTSTSTELSLGTAEYFFGWSVGINGNTVVVGAPGRANASNLAQGAAYVFTSTGGGGGSPVATKTTIQSTSSKYGDTPALQNIAWVAPPPTTVNYTVGPATASDATPTGGTVTVTDDLNPPDACTGSVNNGVGFCNLSISQLNNGTTNLTATYSQPASGFLTSTSAQFPEQIVEFQQCTATTGTMFVKQGASTVETFTFCLSGSNQAVVTAVASKDCLQHGVCKVTVTPEGTAGEYVVSVTITTTTAGCFGNPTGNGCGSSSGGTSPLLPRIWRWPPSGPWWPLALFSLATLLAMRMAFLLVRRRGRRLGLIYSAGLILALVLTGISGCSSSAPVTPVGTYTINVTVTAGGFSVVVPVTVQVTQ